MRGFSMFPVLRPGDRVHVVPDAEPRPGDVLVVRGRAGLVVHRLVALHGSDELVLRGDSWTTADAPVRRSQVVGRVARVERRGRVRAIDGLRSRALGALRPLVARAAGAARRRRQRAAPSRARLAPFRERRAYAANLQRNLLLHRELLRLLARFEAAGVPVIPLKGTLLSLRLHDDLGLRVISDLDLLVRPADLERGREVLEACGYRAEPDLGRYDVGFHRESSQRPRLRVELHRSLGYLAGRGLALPDAVWERASACREEGVGFWRMQPGDELLALALNLVKHRFADALLPLDLSVAASRWQDAIDWDALAERARRLGLHQHVAAALAFARRGEGPALPEEARRCFPLSPWRRRWLEGVEWGGWLPLRGHGQLLLHLLLLAEGGRDRAAHLAAAARVGLRIARQRLAPGRPA